MRFSLVTETYPPEVNGVAHTVHGFEHGLRDLGHAVDVVRPRQASGESAREHEVLVRGAGLPRYPGLRFGLPSGRTLARQWQAQRPDAVYVATEGPLGWSAVRAARRLGIPAATGFHTRFDDYVTRYGAPFLAPAAFAWLRLLHNQGGSTIAPTRELAQFLRERGFRRVEIVGRAVDSARFHPGKRSRALRAAWGAGDEDLVVVHVGRIAPEKNLELAVRAFRALQARQPRAKFVLVGDGPARAALRAAHPDLVFTGAQHGDALAAHFASADLFLFPSLSETFGNVTLEAMASGVPVVAFDYGAAREHGIDGVSMACVECADAEAYVRAALDLADDAFRRARYALNAREHAARLSPRAVQRQFADLLSNLAAEARA